MQLLWPQGFVCPRCGGRRARPSRRGLLRCGQCDYQAVTAGTIFQDTRLPLRTWFRMWWVTSQKNGASALGLQSILGLGSYRTAWALLHKLRRAMVRPGRERLSGRVEVDETYVGGAEEGLASHRRRGRRRGDRKDHEAHPGASKQQLHGFIQEAVEPDSTIHTDGWEGYVGLEALGYRHEYDFLAGSTPAEGLKRICVNLWMDPDTVFCSWERPKRLSRPLQGSVALGSSVSQRLRTGLIIGPPPSEARVRWVGCAREVRTF